MKYTIDVKLIGFEQITVDAASLEEASEKAIDRFWEIYDTAPARALRTKTTECTFLGQE